MEGSNQSNSKNSMMYIILFIITALVIGAILFIFFFNQSKIDQLTRSLEQTQQQVQDVKEETNEKREEAIENADPETLTRLALIKAYAQNLREGLSAAELADLDRITLYIEGNPGVLITKNPNLPQDIAQAVANIKVKARALRSAAVATIKGEVDESTYSLNEVVILTGTIEFVEDDPVLGGSIFSLTDSETDETFYLHFNDTNSTTIKNSMLGEEVRVDVRVTSRANEPLTFEVVRGPTLTSSPTQASQATPTTPAQ